MIRTLFAAALLVPSIALAAGDDDDPPPKPAVSCSGSQVYDSDKDKCVNPQESSLDREDRYLAVRQLSYAGRYLDAQGVLATMQPEDTGRLTYMGFTHRKLGNLDVASVFYKKAIKNDPANILARSYMGQGFVQDGRVEDALAQLQAIRAHGGTGTWAERSLRTAIATGKTNNY